MQDIPQKSRAQELGMKSNMLSYDRQGKDQDLKIEEVLERYCLNDISAKFRKGLLGSNQEEQPVSKYPIDNIFTEDGYVRTKSPGVDENLVKNGKAGAPSKIAANQPFYITEAELQGKKKKETVLEIDFIEPPENCEDPAQCELPSNVSFRRVVINIIHAYFVGKNTKKDKERMELLKKYLEMQENQQIFSDTFWYVICKINSRDGKYPQVEQTLIQRISKNYVKLLLTVPETEKNLVFNYYFDYIAQGILYAFFFAFPKSRDQFTPVLMKKLITLCSKLFTGVQISNPEQYYKKWCLDLGAGNVLKNEENMTKSEVEGSLPRIDFKRQLDLRSMRNDVHLRYSPIVATYLNTRDFHTKELVTGYKMRFSQYNGNQEEIEARFDAYMTMIKNMPKKKDELKELEQAKKDLLREIREEKLESYKHQKRLEKRKNEELEKGAHEYANYLVSMLNSAGSKNISTGAKKAP